jgi:predicted ATPase
MGLLWALLDGMGPLLLEEPELSLHHEIVRYVPQMMIRVQRRRRSAIRQVFLSTHSVALLDDEGIAADEVLMVVPSEKGSKVQRGADIDEIKQLLETGLTAAEVVIPNTGPVNAVQLSLL